MSLFFDYHWTAGHAVRRARAILMAEGLHGVLCKVLDATIYRRTVLIERSLACSISEIHTRTGVIVDRLQESDIPAYLELRARTDPSRLRRRMVERQWCFAARHDGRLIGVVWATKDPERLSALAWTPPLRPTEVYVYDLFVTPDARGGRVASKLLSAMLQYFQTAGYTRVVAAILLQECGVMRLYQQLGFGVYGEMSCLKIGPWKRLFYHDLIDPS